MRGEGLPEVFFLSSLAAGFSGPLASQVKGWRSARDQVLDVLRTLAMVIAVMASRSEAR